MIRKILFSFLFILSSFFFIDNVYADFQEDYYFILDYENAKNIIDDETNIFRDDKSIKYWLNYFKDYIDSNNVNDLGYLILLNSNGSAITIDIALFYDTTNYLGLTPFFQDLFGSISVNVDAFATATYGYSRISFTSYDSSSNFDTKLSSVDNVLQNMVRVQSSGWLTERDSNYTNNYDSISLTENYIFNYNIKNLFVPYYSNIENSVLFFDRAFNSDQYGRRIMIDDNIYSLGDYLPTLTEYFSNQTPDIPINHKLYIPNYYGLFISQIPVSNIYDYELDFTIGQNLILEELNYTYTLFGRKNNNNSYYTYEEISCNVGTSNSEPTYGTNITDINNVYYKKTFGIMDCTSDLSNYDYIYINFYPNNVHSINYFEYSTNYGYVTINDFIGSPYKVLDYYVFTQDTNLMASSKNNKISLYYGSNNLEQFLSTSYNLETFEKKNYFITYSYSDTFNKFERYDYIGTSTNISIGFNLLSNYNSSTLYILVDEDSLISYSEDRTNDSFNYYDSSSNVSSNNFNIYYSFDTSATTSVDSYFVIVSNFIDSISSDINQFSLVLQNLYNLAPVFIQDIILVLFILSMSLILFKLIGK